VEVGRERILSTDPAVLDAGQPPNLVAGHELERLIEVFVRLNTDVGPEETAFRRSRAPSSVTQAW
jgi:hypothetical protein